MVTIIATKDGHSWMFSENEGTIDCRFLYKSCFRGRKGRVWKKKTARWVPADFAPVEDLYDLDKIYFHMQSSGYDMMTV